MQTKLLTAIASILLTLSCTQKSETQTQDIEKK